MDADQLLALDDDVFESSSRRAAPAPAFRFDEPLLFVESAWFAPAHRAAYQCDEPAMSGAPQAPLSLAKWTADWLYARGSWGARSASASDGDGASDGDCVSDRASSASTEAAAAFDAVMRECDAAERDPAVDAGVRRAIFETRVRARVRAGRFRDALDDARTLLAGNSRNATYAMLFAQCAIGCAAADEAVPELQMVVQQMPLYVRPWVMLADCYANQGERGAELACVTCALASAMYDLRVRDCFAVLRRPAVLQTVRVLEQRLAAGGHAAAELVDACIGVAVLPSSDAETAAVSSVVVVAAADSAPTARAGDAELAGAFAPPASAPPMSREQAWRAGVLRRAVAAARALLERYAARASAGDAAGSASRADSSAGDSDDLPVGSVGGTDGAGGGGGGGGDDDDDEEDDVNPFAL